MLQRVAQQLKEAEMSAVELDGGQQRRCSGTRSRRGKFTGSGWLVDEEERMGVPRGNRDAGLGRGLLTWT